MSRTKMYSVMKKLFKQRFGSYFIPSCVLVTLFVEVNIPFTDKLQSILEPIMTKCGLLVQRRFCSSFSIAD